MSIKVDTYEFKFREGKLINTVKIKDTKKVELDYEPSFNLRIENGIITIWIETFLYEDDILFNNKKEYIKNKLEEVLELVKT